MKFDWNYQANILFRIEFSRNFPLSNIFEKENHGEKLKQQTKIVERECLVLSEGNIYFRLFVHK